jgi:hypothetical protein
MAIPHRNYAAGSLAWCPNQHDEPPVDQPRRDKSSLAIVAPAIRDGGVLSREQLCRIREIEPPMLKRQGSLGRIEGHTHGLNVVTEIMGRKT